MQHRRHSVVPWQQRCFLHVVKTGCHARQGCESRRIREEIHAEQEILRKRRINSFS